MPKGSKGSEGQKVKRSKGQKVKRSKVKRSKSLNLTPNGNIFKIRANSIQKDVKGGVSGHVSESSSRLQHKKTLKMQNELKIDQIIVI